MLVKGGEQIFRRFFAWKRPHQEPFRPICNSLVSLTIRSWCSCHTLFVAQYSSSVDKNLIFKQKFLEDAFPAYKFVCGKHLFHQPSQVWARRTDPEWIKFRLQKNNLKMR